MSLESAKRYLKEFGKDKEILEFPVSSATVALAAKALHTEEGRIAKTLSFLDREGQAVLVVMAGDRKVDNVKFKREFGCKARMLTPAELEEKVGHGIGGVCPFGVKKGARVFLDVSLKDYDIVYPACGSENSAIALTLAELEQISRCEKWVDVGKTVPISAEV